MVTILIPTRFDSRYMLELCLKSIRKYTSIPYKIIVGNAGVDEETLDYLSKQSDVKLVNCPDPLRPKDYLARQVDTPYFLFLHDDAQILTHGWLKKRVEFIERNDSIGFLGVVSSNYVYGYKKYFPVSCLEKRFFPFGLLVKKEAQDKLNLNWGKLTGFDTGAIAYLQFLKQKEWKFVKYKFNKDIYHWGGMTWIVRKKLNVDAGVEKTSLNIGGLISDREKKLEFVKSILEKNNF